MFLSFDIDLVAEILDFGFWFAGNSDDVWEGLENWLGLYFGWRCLGLLPFRLCWRGLAVNGIDDGVYCLGSLLDHLLAFGFDLGYSLPFGFEGGSVVTHNKKCQQEEFLFEIEGSCLS